MKVLMYTTWNERCGIAGYAADLVVPQNYYDPVPWPAQWDTARVLINRALPAAELKVALGLHHKVLPATLGVERPNPRRRFRDPHQHGTGCCRQDRARPRHPAQPDRAQAGIEAARQNNDVERDS